MKRLHFIVNGRVQGVGFRYFTVDIAQKENVSGWVRNRHDGSVELEVQGKSDQLDRFSDKLRQGPPLSSVTDLLIKEIPVKEYDSEFRIRR